MIPLFALFLFLAGLVVVISKKNLIALLMGVELMINGAALNFAFYGNGFVAIFLIGMGALASALALAMVLRVYFERKSLDPDKLNALKDIEKC